MARGLDKHQARAGAVAGLGRALSRRAHNVCELCTDKTSLQVIELPPLPEEPDEDHAVMICERCRRMIEGGRKAPPPDELRFLTTTAWSEIAPVQIAAVRTLRRLADEGAAWASDTLDGLYLDPEIEGLI